MRNRGKWGSNSHLNGPQQYRVCTKSLPHSQTVSDPEILGCDNLSHIAGYCCWQGHRLNRIGLRGCHHGIACQGQRWLLASAPFTSENALGHFLYHGSLFLSHRKTNEFLTCLAMNSDLVIPNLFLPTMVEHHEIVLDHPCQFLLLTFHFSVACKSSSLPLLSANSQLDHPCADLASMLLFPQETACVVAAGLPMQTVARLQLLQGLLCCPFRGNGSSDLCLGLV